MKEIKTINPGLVGFKAKTLRTPHKYLSKRGDWTTLTLPKEEKTSVDEYATFLIGTLCQKDVFYLGRYTAVKVVDVPHSEVEEVEFVKGSTP